MSVRIHDRRLRVRALQHLQHHLPNTVPTRFQLVTPELALTGSSALARQMAALPSLLVGIPRSRVRVVHADDSSDSWFYLWPSNLGVARDCLYPFDKAARLVAHIVSWWAQMTTEITDSQPGHEQTDLAVAELWNNAFPRPARRRRVNSDNLVQTRLDVSRLDIGAS